MHQKDVKYKINCSNTEIWTSFAKTCFEFGFACTSSVPNTKLTGLTSFMFKQQQRANTANANICNEPKFVLTGLYRSYDQIHFRGNTRATFLIFKNYGSWSSTQWFNQWCQWSKWFPRWVPGEQMRIKEWLRSKRQHGMGSRPVLDRKCRWPDKVWVETGGQRCFRNGTG